MWMFQILYTKLTAILNKLTSQTVHTFVDQVLKFDINTEERLKGVIDRIFEKAVMEPQFSVAYANMAKCMTVVSFSWFTYHYAFSKDHIDFDNSY